MLIVLWSVKGGVGTTTTAALLASHAASRGDATLAVDVSGDLGAALGVASDSAPGVTDWLASPAPPPDALGRLETSVAPGLALLPVGTAAALVPEHAAVERFAAQHSATSRTVIVDLGTVAPGAVASGPVPPGEGAPGTGWPWLPLLDSAQASLLVVRPCYLALRRAARLGVRPDGVIVVSEPGRSLRAGDVAEVMGVPVVLELAADPAVARAVDAGLVGRRWPRGLQRVLDLVLERLDDPALAW